MSRFRARLQTRRRNIAFVSNDREGSEGQAEHADAQYHNAEE